MSIGSGFLPSNLHRVYPVNLKVIEQILEAVEWLNFIKDECEVYCRFDSPDNENDISENVKVETES